MVFRPNRYRFLINKAVFLCHAWELGFEVCKESGVGSLRYFSRLQSPAVEYYKIYQGYLGAMNLSRLKTYDVAAG